MLLLNALDSKSGRGIGVWLRLLYDSALGKGETEADESLLSSSESLEDKETGKQGALCTLSDSIESQSAENKLTRTTFSIQNKSNLFDVRLTRFVVLVK